MKQAWMDNLTGEYHEDDVPDVPADVPGIALEPSLDERMATVETDVVAITETIDVLFGGA